MELAGGCLLVGLISLQMVNSQDVSTLKLVQIMFRHGDRTADKTYPTGVHGEDFWPQGYSQLTSKGMLQGYDLGRYLRTRYDGYLNSTYVRYEVYTKSTFKDRCIMSGDLVLAGLYPPSGQQIWKQDLLWQPIPVHNNDVDPVLDDDVVCKRYDELYAEVLEGPQAQQVYEENKDFIHTVVTKTGYGEPTLWNAWQLYDPLFVEWEYAIQPAWFTEELYNQMLHLNDLWYIFEYGLKKEMAYLKTGLFMHEIRNNTKTRVDGTMDPRMKLFLYSSHDSMIAATMMALNVWDGHQPPYATALIFELHQKPNGRWFVKVLHKNDTTSNLWGEPYELQIPGCATECPAEDFVRLTEPMVMEREDFDDICGNSESWISSGISKVVVAGGVILLIILMGIIIWCGYSKRRLAQYQRI